MDKRRLRCAIIGAGFSGILMAHRLKTELHEEIEFQIFEKNEDLGGTWFENRYPGCACDVPSHVYQFSFAPNPYWSSYYATSQEIQQYLKAVCRNFDLSEYISFSSPVTRAIWDKTESIWKISVEGKGEFSVEIIVNAGGILNNPQMPTIKGLDTFSGDFLHTAQWDPKVSLDGKSIALIGAGASAIQILPQIQPIAKHIDLYIRTPSWISPPIGAPKGKNPPYTIEEQERFRDDPVFSLTTRKTLESSFNTMFKAFFKGTDQQKDLRNKFETRMKELIPDPELQKKLIPDFEVGCRRINPGEAYLTSLQNDNVTPIFGPISEIVTDGVVSDGETRPADVIIAATGFNTGFRPRFPIIGRNGVNLQDLWAKEPTSYLGTGVSGYPNYLIFLGPNTPISNGSITGKLFFKFGKYRNIADARVGPLEATADYFIKLIRKMHTQRAKSFDVRPEVQLDFDEHTQRFMKDMVWTGTCRSWFKKSDTGKVTALWPGSSLHYMDTLAENRWEDYEWSYTCNRFSYWDEGFSKTEKRSILEKEKAMEGVENGEAVDFSYYLHSAPPIPLDAFNPPKPKINGVFNGSASEPQWQKDLVDAAAMSV